ncbi:MAG: serine hydrolase domain-containing protein [Alphaproteobacteria bacterium]
MQRYVDQETLAGVSSAVLVGRDLVDIHCTGLADRKNGEPLRVDYIHRAFSNTKLVASCAVLLLLEEGHFQLDDPIERFIPQLGERQVLRPVRPRSPVPKQRQVRSRSIICWATPLAWPVVFLSLKI